MYPRWHFGLVCDSMRNFLAGVIPVKRGIDVRPRQSTEVMLDERCSKHAEAGGRSRAPRSEAPSRRPEDFQSNPICETAARLAFARVSSGVPITG